jgi:serine protease Do
VRATSTFVPARPLEPAPQASGVIERLGVSVRASLHGLVVVAMDLDGPAAQAGTLIGDVVVAVNGAAPGDVPGLQRLVKAAPGAIQLDLRRRGAAHQVAIRLGDPAQAAEGAGTWTAFGLQVKDLPDAARKALGVTSGVIVTRIRAPADRTRILPGDVIVAIDRQAVQSAEEFLRLAERAAERKSAAVGLLVKRADADLFIPVESGEARAGTNGAGDASRGGGAPRLEERYRRRGPTGTPLRT